MIKVAGLLAASPRILHEVQDGLVSRVEPVTADAPELWAVTLLQTQHFAIEIDHLVEHRIPLEVCPTSNIRTGVVGSWAEHPVIELIERGARVTINSDDPTYFGSSLAGDLRAVAGLVELDVERHTRYAVEASFQDDAARAALAARISEWWRAWEGGAGA